MIAAPSCLLYHAEQTFEDQEALKRALHGGVLKTLIVESSSASSSS
jgi:hypothetical protein